MGTFAVDSQLRCGKRYTLLQSGASLGHLIDL